MIKMNLWKLNLFILAGKFYCEKILKNNGRLLGSILL